MLIRSMNWGSCILVSTQQFHSSVSKSAGTIKRSLIPALSTINCKSKGTITTPSSLNERRSANYAPSTWNLDFLQSSYSNYKLGNEREKINKLVLKVKDVIADEKMESITILELIDDIQRLGIGDHFKKDIDVILKRVVANMSSLELDLHTTALAFRLSRQNGLWMSPDMFEQFKDENSNFKSSIANDFKGLLSLYEASYLSIEGEELLDEAKTFCIGHLNRLNRNQEDEFTADIAKNALKHPLHYRMPRIEARRYIETYPRSDAKCGTDLLELAKLDFNMNQMMLRGHLREISKWWSEIELVNHLIFARDRLMECFLWAIGNLNKAHCSACCSDLTKLYNLVVVIDDIYDVYGQIPELELFTAAVERWDVNAIDDLPSYMKVTFLALYNTVNGIGYNILKKKSYNCIPFLKKSWEDLSKGFLLEAKWNNDGYLPTLEEYFNNSWLTNGGVVFLTYAYFSTSQEITPEALDCLHSHPPIFHLSCIVFRVVNDLATSEVEIEKGETVKAMQCYAQEAGVSIEDARAHIVKSIDKSWKNMNKMRINNNSPLSNDVIEIAMNLARTAQYAYSYGDCIGSPDVIKKQVLSLIVEPV